MKNVFAYIRVSTQKQGSEGASLPEQKDSITNYCKRNNLCVIKWYEETETAAKRGRKQFSEMMRLVKKGKAQALVFHKIDRSTRNLFEWAEVSSLPEIGIDVHYSHEPVDLTTTHGRTAADVAAVFASAYIRNLREEVKKGIQGRLKQGFYPFRAPVGYIDNGKAKLKTIDPIKGPLVKKLFEKYASGDFTQKEILALAEKLGLSGVAGNVIKKSTLSFVLHNPFYMGLIKIKRSGETFSGAHIPLIEPKLFRQVQAVLDGRLVPKKTREKYLFQKMLKCQSCGYHLIAERQKGHVYYRCHECPGTCLREYMVEDTIKKSLKKANLNDSERAALQDDIQMVLGGESLAKKEAQRVLRLQVSNLNQRLEKLTDAYLEGMLTKEEYEGRKEKLFTERMDKEAQMAILGEDNRQFEGDMQNYLELAISMPDRYITENVSEKRDLLKLVTSNIFISHKTVMPQWRSGFQVFVSEREDYVVPIPGPHLEADVNGTDSITSNNGKRDIKKMASDFVQAMRDSLIS
jgi:site-specific DNA recombinase